MQRLICHEYGRLQCLLLGKQTSVSGLKQTSLSKKMNLRNAGLELSGGESEFEAEVLAQRFNLTFVKSQPPSSAYIA